MLFVKDVLELVGWLMNEKPNPLAILGEWSKQ